MPHGAQLALILGNHTPAQAFAKLPPGRYVFFCPPRDRDGGKRHFLEGLLTQVEIR